MSDERLLQRLKQDLTPRADALEKDNDTQKAAVQGVSTSFRRRSGSRTSR